MCFMCLKYESPEEQINSFLQHGARACALTVMSRIETLNLLQ